MAALPAGTLAQIVITRLRDRRYRVLCFDGHEIVDELITHDLARLFEFTDRLQSLGGWEPPPLPPEG